MHWNIQGVWLMDFLLGDCTVTMKLYRTAESILMIQQKFLLSRSFSRCIFQSLNGFWVSRGCRFKREGFQDHTISLSYVKFLCLWGHLGITEKLDLTSVCLFFSNYIWWLLSWSINQIVNYLDFYGHGNEQSCMR